MNKNCQNLLQKSYFLGWAISEQTCGVAASQLQQPGINNLWCCQWRVCMFSLWWRKVSPRCSDFFLPHPKNMLIVKLIGHINVPNFVGDQKNLAAIDGNMRRIGYSEKYWQKEITVMNWCDGLNGLVYHKKIIKIGGRYYCSDFSIRLMPQMK